MNKWNIFEKLKLTSNSKNEEKNQIEIQNNSEELQIKYTEIINTGKQNQREQSSEMFENILPSSQLKSYRNRDCFYRW